MRPAASHLRQERRRHSGRLWSLRGLWSKGALSPPGLSRCLRRLTCGPAPAPPPPCPPPAPPPRVLSWPSSGAYLPFERRNLSASATGVHISLACSERQIRKCLYECHKCSVIVISYYFPSVTSSESSGLPNFEQRRFRCRNNTNIHLYVT